MITTNQEKVQIVEKLVKEGILSLEEGLKLLEKEIEYVSYPVQTPAYPIYPSYPNWNQPYWVYPYCNQPYYYGTSNCPVNLTYGGGSTNTCAENGQNNIVFNTEKV